MSYVYLLYLLFMLYLNNTRFSKDIYIRKKSRLKEKKGWGEWEGTF